MDINNIIKSMAVGLILTAPATAITAQRFAVKAAAGIGLGNAVSLSSPVKLGENSSSADNFGVDFGYKVWELNKMNLEVNLGVGYESISTRLGLDEWNYSYAAGADADEDGNRYIRYYDLRDIQQKVNVGYFTVPVYLSYNYSFSKRIAMHVDAGVRFGLRMSAKLGECSADSYTYGVYPEYDNLMIDACWLNGFGESKLGKDRGGVPSVNGFTASAMVGLGVEVRIAGPVSLDLGIRYAAGLTNVYNHIADQVTNVSAETAPVTYTVAGGESVRPLTDYATKSSLSQLSLRAGLTFRF